MTVTINIGGHAVSNRIQAIELLDSLKPDQCLLIEKVCSVIAFFSGQSRDSEGQGGNP